MYVVPSCNIVIICNTLTIMSTFLYLTRFFPADFWSWYGYHCSYLTHFYAKNDHDHSLSHHIQISSSFLRYSNYAQALSLTYQWCICYSENIRSLDWYGHSKLLLSKASNIYQLDDFLKVPYMVWLYVSNEKFLSRIISPTLTTWGAFLYLELKIKT